MGCQAESVLTPMKRNKLLIEECTIRAVGRLLEASRRGGGVALLFPAFWQSQDAEGCLCTPHPGVAWGRSGLCVWSSQ